MGLDDDAVDNDPRRGGPDGDGSVALGAKKRPREGQEDDLIGLPDQLRLRCPLVAAAATRVAEAIAGTKRGTSTVRVPFFVELCAREGPGPDEAYVQLAPKYPVQLSPILRILARHRTVRARVDAREQKIIFAPAHELGEFPQRKATYERALAVALRTPAETLQTTQVNYLDVCFDQILAPSPERVLPLANLLNYAEVLEDAWLIVDECVGVLRKKN